MNVGSAKGASTRRWHLPILLKRPSLASSPLRLLQDSSTQAVNMAECSVIVVTYNGLLENTIPCLESIFRRTHGEDYEVIVVDNSSSDGTPIYLTELATREPRLKCVLNPTNRGFAGGNNDGIHSATGSIIVLLNNDT